MKKQFMLFTILLILVTGCTGPRPDPVEPTPTVAIPTAAPALETPTTAPAATATPPAAQTSEVTAAPAAYGPSGFPVHVNPLTGKEVSDPQLLERRPVAIKIQMFPRGQRPPYGISMADIVYDYYQNFGLTRFHAIFYSQNAQIAGPIRSARLLDIDLVDMYKSVFAFGSAEQRTFSRLFNQEFAPRLVVEGSSNCPPMCRLDPNADNLLVANTQEMSTFIVSKGVDNARQNLDGMRFDPSLPANGQAGQQITVRHSISGYARWEFDAANGRYLRFQDVQEAPDVASEVFEPLMDRLTNAQVTADNVVVLVVGHHLAFGSKVGPNEVIEIGLQGTGPAYAYRDGQVFQLNWNRPTKDAIVTLTFEDGTQYPFKPGNTWFEVIGKSSQISTEGAAWRFQHSLP
jgi:hypothetical protein